MQELTMNTKKNCQEIENKQPRDSDLQTKKKSSKNYSGRTPESISTIDRSLGSDTMSKNGMRKQQSKHSINTEQQRSDKNGDKTLLFTQTEKHPPKP
ncbi:hypothetical protein HanIR_Chr09g0449041 [Helianthus annuus]|nr:hypothetical protein HanIR_Chr09g0449041 [Helianthus annuus]